MSSPSTDLERRLPVSERERCSASQILRFAQDDNQGFAQDDKQDLGVSSRFVRLALAH